MEEVHTCVYTQLYLSMKPEETERFWLKSGLTQISFFLILSIYKVLTGQGKNQN